MFRATWSLSQAHSVLFDDERIACKFEHKMAFPPTSRTIYRDLTSIRNLREWDSTSEEAFSGGKENSWEFLVKIVNLERQHAKPFGNVR